MILTENSYFHVTWKCHNNSFLLQRPETKKFLYQTLLRYKKKYRIKIFAYCLMDNHPHIVGFTPTVKGFSDYFRTVNTQVAKFINRLEARRGQVVMDRFRSPLIQSERHLMSVLHYLDQNPVRAGVCKHPREFRWSSYMARAHGRVDPLLDPLPEGVRIETKTYLLQSEYHLKRGLERLRLFKDTFFIGTPLWVRTKRIELFQKFLASPNGLNNPEGPKK